MELRYDNNYTWAEIHRAYMEALHVSPQLLWICNEAPLSIESKVAYTSNNSYATYQIRAWEDAHQPGPYTIHIVAQHFFQYLELGQVWGKNKVFNDLDKAKEAATHINNEYAFAIFKAFTGACVKRVEDSSILLNVKNLELQEMQKTLDKFNLLRSKTSI